jgi:hypothetical protein
MLIELPPAERDRLRPLFAGFPGSRGIVDAGLEGTMGRPWADATSRPTVGLIDLDFCLLAGDPGAPAAGEAVRRLEPPWSAATLSPAWELFLRRVWGASMATRVRLDFSPGR